MSWARGKFAKFIDDRSGFKKDWRRAVKEPGTGYMVTKEESDGRWNIVDHPQNHVVVHKDEMQLSWTRPEQTQLSYDEDFLLDELGDPIIEELGVFPLEDES